MDQLLKNDAERMLRDHRNSHFSPDLAILNAMKEYAEIYARQCLELAAKNAKIVTRYDYWENTHQVVDPASITEIQLPPHI